MRPSDEDARAGVTLVVEYEIAVVAPSRKQALFKASAFDALQPFGGNDLVGVDVAAFQRHCTTRDDSNLLHCAVTCEASARFMRDLSGWRSGR